MAGLGLFALRESAVVAAGAGTGKTHSLVTLCLHLLGGVGRPEPLPPSRLCAITFTEKAAAELQARLRQRVERLAAGSPELTHAAGTKGAPTAGDPAKGVEALEPELAASAREAGQRLPTAETWQRVRRDLGNAQIGTIHSLCAQILRRHAAAAGLPPGFGMVDEADGRALLRDACEETVALALQGQGPKRAAADRLCTELGFRGNGRFGRGLAEELAKILGALGESGQPFRARVDLEGFAAEEQAARRSATEAFSRLGVAARQALSRKRSDPVERIASACAVWAAQIGPALAALPAGELGRVWPAIDALELGQRRGELADAIGAAKDAIEALPEADAQLRSGRLLTDLEALTTDALARHQERKKRAGALDFDDLTRRAQELLANHPWVRRAEKERLGALLVDEFQDTSRAQIALLGWLAEPPDEEGTAPAGSGKPGALPVPPGRCVLVGDRKQSIYEFRGADVAGAQRFAGQLIADGARPHHLRTSRRSLPPLVAFTNALFARVLAPAGQPFHTTFTLGEDDLTAHRVHESGAPCAELIQVKATGPDAVQEEANAVGKRIGQLLAEGTARGGDVAILLRAFTHVDAYRRALLQRRIPHLVWQGRGFFGAREVSDLLALLSAALDPEDIRSLATVLRSPFGPLSDEALLLLARGPRRGQDGEAAVGRGLARRALSDETALASLEPDDAAAARRIEGLLRTVQAASARLGPASLLELALEETDFIAACATGLHGEQAAANVEKLLAMARAAELRGTGLRDFIARVRDLRDEEAREPDGSVVEEGDPHAVRILTVHAAKGLEFPIVVVPECGARLTPNPDALLLDPELGPALRIQGVDGKPKWGPRGKAVNDLRTERELAQSRRLFYVAATRARDRVIFSGREPRNAETWRTWLDALAGSANGKELITVIDAEALKAAPLAAGRALVERDPGLAAALREGRCDAPPPPADWPELDRALRAASGAALREAGPATLVLPVTQLADAILCPRRYQLLHELRLPEWPDRARAPEEDEPGEDPEAPSASRAELGTLAHKLLERFPLREGDLAGPRASAAVPARLETLRRLAREEGHDPAQPEVAAVLDAAAALLGSALGARLAATEPGHLYRELAFTLRVPPDGADAPEVIVRGQIDALILGREAGLVVDYKLAAPHHDPRYERQLGVYELAAHELVRGALPIRTALAFLKGPAGPLEERPPLDVEGRETLRSSISEAGRAIAAGRANGRFELIAAEGCQEIGCGFFGTRCPGGASIGLATIATPPAAAEAAATTKTSKQLKMPW